MTVGEALIEAAIAHPERLLAHKRSRKTRAAARQLEWLSLGKVSARSPEPRRRHAGHGR